MPVTTPHPQPPAVTIKNVSKHCQVSPRGQNLPGWRPTALTAHSVPVPAWKMVQWAPSVWNTASIITKLPKERPQLKRKQAPVWSAVSVPFNCKFGQALLSEVQNVSRLGHWYYIRIKATREAFVFVESACMGKTLLIRLFWISVEAINKVFSLFWTGFDLFLSLPFQNPLKAAFIQILQQWSRRTSIIALKSLGCFLHASPTSARHPQMPVPLMPLENGRWMNWAEGTRTGM